MGVLMARVNYQRDKRLKDLDRQRKQEEKRNKKLLKDLGYDYSEVTLPNTNRSRIVGAVTGKGTVPQVFINGKHIGGLEDLQSWAKKAA